METSQKSIMTISNPPFPRVMRIEPASQCNLACTHCPTGTVDMDRGVMSEPMFDLVLEELKNNIDSIQIVVLYHGGEPLLNSRFYDMVKRIKLVKPSIFVKSVTNGMALNELNAIKLVESRIDAIEISLDGSSADESMSIRRNSNTEKIVFNIKQLISLRRQMGSERPKISLATTQFIKSKEELFLPLQPAMPPKWLRDEFSNVLDFKVTYGVRWPHMNVFDYEQITSPLDKDFKTCDHVINTITIRSDGDVVPCCYDLTSKLVMGNIANQSLRSIWEGDSYSRLRGALAKGNLYSICRTCAVVTPPVYLVPKQTRVNIPIIQAPTS
jgi:radical SAM protein with 4Fe4S-binding SPASM domain